MITAPKLKVGPAQAKVRMVSLEDLPVYVKALVYAQPGVGKTYLGATAPDPVILLSEVEVSKPTLKLAAQKLGVAPQIIVIESLDDVEASLDFLESGQHDRKTLVLDSASDLNRFVIRHMVREGMIRRSSHDPDVPEMGDWFRVEERMRHYLRRLRNIPMHVMVISLLTDVREDMLVAPSLQPKRLMYDAAAYFNLVGQLVAKETGSKGGEIKRELYVEPSQTRIAKNPGNTLPPIIENPNLTDIFNTVVEQLAADRVLASLAGPPLNSVDGECAATCGP